MTDSQYYVMKEATVQGIGCDCLSDGVRNEAGQFLQPVCGKEEVRHAYALKRRLRPLADWISIVGGWLALSEKASGVFRDFKVCESVQWVPLTVHDRREKPLTEGTLFYGFKRWEILDLVKSEYTYYPETDVIHKVQKWVLCDEEIPPLDAFRLRQHHWVISASLHDAIISADLTGFSFLATE